MKLHDRKKNPPIFGFSPVIYPFLFFMVAFICPQPIFAQQNDGIALSPQPTPRQQTGQNHRLPLKLIEFAGSPVKDIVLLRWTTTAEININHFELEKSINNENFSFINKQTAKGITNNAETYQAEDFKPASGINYYRLKIAGNDGVITYSKTITVKHK